MKRGPLLTLLVVVVLALGLLAVNMMRGTNNPTPTAAAGTPPAAPAAPAAPPAAAPAAPNAQAGGNAQADPNAAAPNAQAPNAQAGPGAPLPEAFPEDAKYTGKTEEPSNIAIAVTVRNNQVSAYLCNGKDVEAWYQGSVLNGGKIDASGKNGNKLTGSLSDGKLSGTVSAKGRSWEYSADAAKAPAGLYRSKNGSRTSGWIKDSYGNVTGLANEGGAPMPAAPLEGANAQYVGGGDLVVSR
ncbi:hypothetical protein BKA01_001746 [Pseudonocardia eucalypti]|nr:hypothetical protein [Pseudonocardia eucalypti]